MTDANKNNPYRPWKTRRIGEAHLFAVYAPAHSVDGSIDHVYKTLAQLLADTGTSIFQERVFCKANALYLVSSARNNYFKDTPFTIIQGQPVHNGPVAGIIVHATTYPTRDVLLNDATVGRHFSADSHSFASIGGLYANDATTLVSRLEATLKLTDLTPTDIRRTWFYLDNILSWYDDFNRQRDNVYRKLKMLGSRPTATVPASTGIQGCCEGKHALCALCTDAPTRILKNPGQKEAYHYGSSFSRAAAIDIYGGQLIELSGTAAIDQSGASIHTDSFTRQLAVTFDKIALLLQPTGATIQNLVAGCAFIKRGEDIPSFHRYCTIHNLSALPIVPIVADVCRDDLLFEFDGELFMPHIAK